MRNLTMLLVIPALLVIGLVLALLVLPLLGCPSGDDDDTTAADDDSASDDDTTDDDDTTATDDDDTTPPPVDDDGDGFAVDIDCDDLDASITPVYVSVAAEPGGDGSLLAPFTTVADALAAGTGCVLLMGGIYSESAMTIAAGTRVWITGISGSAATRIDADENDRMFTVEEGATLTLSGVHMLHGRASGGGCIRVEAAELDVDDVRFDECVSTGDGGAIHVVDGTVTMAAGNTHDGYALSGHGGAIYAEDSAVWIEDSRFDDVEASEYGGALSLYRGDHAVWRSSFLDCRADDGGAIDLVGDGSLEVVGTLFRHDEAVDPSTMDVAYGGAIASTGATLSVRNCTLVDNVAEAGSGIYFHTALDEDTFELRNSLLIHHEGAALDMDGIWGLADAAVLYNGWYGNDELYDGTDDPSFFDESNLFDDPGFVSYVEWPDAVDLHLGPGSPAIDAGDPDPQYDDLDGTRADMGCYGGPAPLAD